MAESNEEWECSKENIRPIQQGRKQKVLKVALTSQPKDIILQQKQAFENELRTYSGSDPLAVWYKYIKWVEQNYPKGGREGHIKQLVAHCLSVLKDHTNYFDDDRFIEIMLKHANLSEKPIEVYNNMYSSNIGCKSAKFFINWSWELEQLGSLKKADDVLTEGLERRAEPIEKLQTYRQDFEIRFANKIKGSLESNHLDSENGRSAFSVLKPQKKNFAPILRTGEAVIEKKTSLFLGKQQPQPRNSASSAKVPFKIYNSENINPLPIQSNSVFQSAFNSGNSKENDRKPTKWNTAKVKSHGVKPPGECNPDFKFHCDDENDQQLRTPRSVPKTSNILSTRRRTPSPPIALFEPPDPLKKPMYPKNKVYGGAEEYSLEEIRAAEWLDKRKRAEQDRLLVEKQRKIEEQVKREEELKKQVEFLSKKVEILENKFTSSVVPSKLQNDLANESKITSLKNFENGEFKKKMLNNENESSSNALIKEVSIHPTQEYLQNSSCGQLKNSSHNISLFKSNSQDCNYSLTESFKYKCPDNASYYNADKIVQDLYNGTLYVPVQDESKNQINQLQSTKNECSEGLPFSFYFDSTAKISDSRETNCPNDVKQVSNSQKNFDEATNNLPFSFFHDPTEGIPEKSSNEIISFQESGNEQNCSRIKQIHTNISKTCHDQLPFTLFCDPTETSHNVIPVENANIQNRSQNDPACVNIKEASCNILPFTLFCDATEAIPNSIKATSFENIEAENDPLPNEKCCEENVENIPPREYIQEKEDRELAGILQPSKNVFYIPLEQQQLDDDDDFEVEDDYIHHNEKQHVDDTMIPPSNTEQFSAAKFLASTPYVPKPTKSSYSEESGYKNSSSKKDVTEDSCLSSRNLNSVQKDFLYEENAASKIELKLATEPDSNMELKSACYSRLPNILSVIMETSTENYSKSSSSSSSASLTKSNNLDQYVSQHFSLRKNYSKFDVQEAVNLSSVSEVSEKVCIDKSFSNASAFNKENGENVQKFSVDFDPYDQKVIKSLLNSIDITNYENVFCINKSIRMVKTGENIVIGNSTYIIEDEIAEGAYAKVYKCFITDSGFTKMVALKVCKKANEWELYICNEVQNRLLQSKFIPDIRNSVMNVTSAIKFSDGIVLISDFSDFGTLLDVVNFYKKQISGIPEVVVMYFTLEMLHIVSKLHKCNIIHGDIKPDNFLLVNNDFNDVLGKMSETTCLRLIDFGRAIDLNLYDKGICFTTSLAKNHFKCNEMKDNRPWVFQLDWYGVLSCIHTMLFSEYMAVKKNNGVWEIEKKFKRYWCTSLWEPLFNKLLNIPDCYEEPDVSEFTNMIESKLKHTNGVKMHLNRFSYEYKKRL